MNSIIKKDKYLLFLINKIQDRIGNAQIFIKIDLKWVCHQIRIKEKNEWKRAFKTNKKLFKLTMLQFGFTNTPAIF